MTDLKPIDFGLPQHDAWRKFQYESIQNVLDFGNVVSLVEMPTGSGKTAMATAVASRYAKSVSLCSTRILQSQYSDGYNWYKLEGKSHYPCAHPDADDGMMADDCLLPETVRDCPESWQCEYLMARDRARGTKLLNINYAIWLSSPFIRSIQFDYMTLDEMHLLSEIVLNYVGITINNRDVAFWGLPVMPTIEDSKYIFARTANPHATVMGWAHQCEKELNAIAGSLLARGLEDPKTRKRYKSATGMKGRFEAVRVALQTSSDDWYIKSEQNGEQRLIARPLTARYHFPNIFLKVPKIVAMSATIGAPEVMAKELGISEFRHLSVPSVWPPETRPIHVLDCPAMGYSAAQRDPGIFDEQARKIAEFIKQYPKEWSGLILVTRRSEASILVGRLAKLGLSDRVWPFPEVGTGEQLASWNMRKKRVPNSIGVSWSVWEGFDGWDLQLLVIAKVPFPTRGEAGSYEFERMNYDHSFYNLRAALQIEQGCGRIRRGNRVDYDVDGVAVKAVAIADGSLGRIKKYLSESFKECLVYQKGE